MYSVLISMLRIIYFFEYFLYIDLLHIIVSYIHKLV